MLIPQPLLDIRNEDRLAAEAIGRTTGALTVERVDAQIRQLTELRGLLASGALGSNAPICPELTNVNPSAPHTVILEAQAWLVAQLAYKLNQVPERDLIEFARLFSIELKPATAAHCKLRFSGQVPINQSVTIPAGTQVATEDGTIIFETLADMGLRYGQTSVVVAGRCMQTGYLALAPDTLINLLDPIAFISAVTNLDAVESGSEAEQVVEALARLRTTQRRGQRLVSAQDFEDAILEEVLNGVGTVRAFPFVAAGKFEDLHAGHTSIVVMGATGQPVNEQTRAEIRILLEQAIGNQYIYLLDPEYISFDVRATVRLTGIATQAATLAAAERRLREYYAPNRGAFGRPILRTEIIALIESTAGVERIISPVTGPILTAPQADVILAAHQLPRLGAVMLEVAA